MVTAALLSVLSLSQISADARLMKFPDIYENRIVFQYGGDLWLVSTEGGVARRITTSPGVETWPKFSPDGKWIAFSADYDGNMDVYVMPSEGGEPKRLTSHPRPDQVLDWSADGKQIIFRSSRESKNGRYAGAFVVPAAGGTPQALPMEECGQVSPSPDGHTFAYNRMPTENATWKRYRGGLQSWISFYDLQQHKYWEMKRDRSAQMWPMWGKDKLYYVGDADNIRNLWAFDPKTNAQTQLTKFTEYDVSWPSIGTGEIVFVRDAKLWVYHTDTGKVSDVKVSILSDLPETRSSTMSLANSAGDVSISPNGVRLAIEARGEIFSVPVREGLTHNITNTPGARERYPRWSPDGKWILFASDRSGEYEFFLQKSDLSEPAKVIASAAGTFPLNPVWSPDSKKFFFTDTEYRLNIVDIGTGSKTTIPKTAYPSYQDAVWSPDSKWIAYSSGRTQLSRIALLNVETKEETLMGDGMFADSNPVFDAKGNYLFFVSQRNVGFTTDAYEFLPVATNPSVILGWTLRTDTPTPFAPKDDNEKIGDAKPAGEAGSQENKPWDLAGAKARLFSVPIPAGTLTLVGAPAGRVLYASDGALMQFDFNSKGSSPVISGASALDFTPNYDKFAYIGPGGVVGVLPAAPGGQIGGGKVNTGDMMAVTEPRAEWKQAYWEAWRYVRDYFWNENMNGMNWRAVGERYAKWLPYVAHRSDLDQLLWELLADLGTGHAYLTPAPASRIRPIAVGLLGADYDVTSSGVRFKKIYRGQPWDSGRRAPLGEPGLNVNEGDYLISIDGEKLGPGVSVDDLLQGKADKLVELKVNSTNSETGARRILVRTTSDDLGLRYADWVTNNRLYVEKQSGGRIGYVHVPSTSVDGVVEFWRMYFAQVDKDALIIDERYNSGGFIPDFFVEKLGRTPLGGFTPRGMEGQQIPGGGNFGPKVMLINSYAGSGGDAFPFFFRKRKIGPLIGTRTWGGLIGITGRRDLMIGGGITVPQFAFWDVDANGQAHWAVENLGVPPDIEVDNKPDDVARGEDAQLDAAINYLKDQLKKTGYKKPTLPKYPGSGG